MSTRERFDESLIAEMGNLAIARCLDDLGIYWKEVKDGNRRWYHVNALNTDYDFSITGVLWNDLNNPRKVNEPNRVGIISFYQYVFKTDFVRAVKRLKEIYDTKPIK
jgi:hypothetical protein